jgi:hypothetical protein
MVPCIGRAGNCGEVSRQQGYRSTHSGASRCAPTSVRTGKAADVIGLYLAPPQHAAVFCVDEKTAIQALDLARSGASVVAGPTGTARL